MRRAHRLVLAGDIGGTNARLALFSSREGQPRLEALEVLPSRAHASFCAVLDAFRARHPERLAAACLGIAGPVRNGRVAASNLPWVVDAAEVAARLGLDSVELLNDLEAAGHGLCCLGPADLAVLNAGAEDARGSRVLISAGTGLGEAALPWLGAGRVPVASEAGHADFAPRSELEIELLRFLLREHGRVSYERVLSGPGLHNIYRFLRDTGRGVEDAALARRLSAGDPPAVVTQAALDGSSALCARALELFVAIYGAEAGNAALRSMASGGVFLGGGIAPRLLSVLRQPAFMDAFRDKGRLRPFLETVPVRVVLEGKVALYGAARRAFLSLDTWALTNK